MKGELRWRGPNSISKFDHHNIYVNGGAVQGGFTIDIIYIYGFYKRRVDVVFAIYIAVVHTWSFFSD
jgi:hypothetical protein